ncbi:hypothetical protein U9W_00675 [Enterococcus faecium EnGen0261]|nr:hypothetical protein SKI_00883 [Enterococcus faecium EnGen0167]EOM12565.1 hypothetical protein U9W_00675 [Enterococcus faecium EnGen0261]
MKNKLTQKFKIISNKVPEINIFKVYRLALLIVHP